MKNLSLGNSEFEPTGETLLKFGMSLILLVAVFYPSLLGGFFSFHLLNFFA